MTRFLFCCKNTRSATGIRGLDTHAPAVKVVSMTPSQTSLQDSPRVAQVIAAELARHVTDVVVCPGSRNAPLSLALAARPDLRIHVRIDERSAAFLALGMARVQRRAVPVVMTSGTAVANCLPAVVEAHHSNTPMLVVSADRPARLVGTGASQTINQQGIFGEFAPTVHLPAGVGDEEAEQATLKALELGVAQLNVALEAPLVGKELPLNPEPVSKEFVRPRRVDHGEVALDLSENTLVIAGDEAWEVPGLEDVPTIAEPTAPAPYHPVHPLAAGVFAREQLSAEGYVVDAKPKQVVVVGHPTLHRDVFALMKDPSIRLVCLSRSSQVTDPYHRADAVGTTVKVSGQCSDRWLRLCEAASDMAAQAVRDTLEEDHGFTGLHVAAGVADTLAVGDSLVLGASNPVRDASFAGLPFDGVDTYAPRGAAGIDGTVAQAVGVALATQARCPDEPRAPRTVALMGDVTFLHDAGGLLVCEGSARPENLTIVVANDNGCGIFEALEMGAPDMRPQFERLFGTPHGVELGDVARGYGADFLQVDTLPALIDALVDTAARPSPSVLVIEAVTTRSTRRALHASIADKVAM